MLDFLRKPPAPEAIVASAERVLGERRETLEAIRQSALAMGAPAPAAAARVGAARNVALFFAAPFIGLAYIVAFPFVGFWALGKLLLKAAAGSR